MHAESPQYEDLQNLALGMANRIEELEGAIRNLHKVRGRHHTQQACEALFALVGLDNNIGAKNDWNRKLKPVTDEGLRKLCEDKKISLGEGVDFLMDFYKKASS